MSLENFRKQAKLLVCWHRERNYSVGGRIRQLSRYRELTDPETLALPFPLNEAQEIICAGTGLLELGRTQRGPEKSLAIGAGGSCSRKADEGDAGRARVRCAGSGRVLS